MIQAGYMAKRIATRSEWFGTATFDDIFSVSNCISSDFADYIDYWKHNAHWFFDSAEIIRELAAGHAIGLSGCMFFYYEFYEFDFDDEKKQWSAAAIAPAAASVAPAVVAPAAKRLEGYDVLSMHPEGSPPGCSPLSCNNLAATLPVNRHCLLESLGDAKRLLESGAFHHSEPGPYRIFAVYSIE